MRQYVEVEFHPRGHLYTYHNDGDPVKGGDEVLVPDRRGGSNRVKAVRVRTGGRPIGFETTAILGLAPPREEEQA